MLRAHGVAGICGVDTRRLTRRIRDDRRDPRRLRAGRGRSTRCAPPLRPSQEPTGSTSSPPSRRRSRTRCPPPNGSRGATSSPTTTASSTRSCATSPARHGRRRAGDDARRRGAGPRTRRHLPVQRSRRSGVRRAAPPTSSPTCSARRCRCSASASGISCWRRHSAGRPSSCRSATTAPTTRCRTSRRGRSRSPARTTTSRSPPTVSPSIATVTHVNLNDGVCEGLAGRSTPTPSPCSTTPRPVPGRTTAPTCSSASPSGWHGRRASLVPRRDDITSVLVIGSGPIVIGQACEFDYSGTQACRVLREEGYRVILANSNPATIMTDPGLRRPHLRRAADGTRAGGDHRAGATRRRAADARRPDRAQRGDGAARRRRRSACPGHRRCSVPTPRRSPPPKTASSSRRRWSASASTCRPRAAPTPSTRRWMWSPTIGLPVIIRPAYILGGRGTGIASTAEEFRRLAAAGLAASPIGEILIEESIAGWKEFELEVMRDRADNCVIICSIENVDPMGVHTGDSITVAPAQTLSDVEYQEMRDVGLHLHPPRRRRDGRLERAVRPRSGDRSPGHHRDEPARVALVGAGLEGDRVSRSPRSPPSSPSATRSTRSPTTSPASPRRASSRRSTTS